MKNISIFSNAFTARTLTFQMEYLLDISINTIFLMAENHHKDEVFSIGGNSQICILSTFDECVNLSDIIIIDQIKTSPPIADKKDCLIINSPWKNKANYKTDIDAIPKINYSSKPVIVILSLGEYTDQYYVEILVNKILSEKNAKIMQIFSPETKNVLSSFSRYNYLNHNLRNAQDNEFDVIVLSIKGITNDATIIRLIKEVSPDVLILCVDYSFNKAFEIRNYFKSICNVDIIIKSPYISYEVVENKTYPVYCGIENTNVFKNSLDNNLENELRAMILQRIYLPSNIYIL